ncbi:MAG: histidine phosphatase family protein [Ornithinimicrobium sp.]
MSSARRLVIEADGGSRGNPGVAGYGALVRDPDSGRILAQRAAPLGTASNNVAEYSGLIAGLQAVLELDLATDVDLTAKLDSKLVVEQMAGRWKIKHADMRRLAMEARDLIHQIGHVGGSVEFKWIPRNLNADADKLSNDGMDGRHVRIDSVEEPATDADEVFATTGGGAGGSQEPGPGVSTPAGIKTSTPTPGRPPTFGDARVPVSVAASAIGESPPAMSDPVRIILVRHGVTDYTLASRLDGRDGADPALHARGETQAAAAAAAIAQRLERSEGPIRVVTSSLRRARQTGDAIAEALGVQADQDADWDEQNFGDWDGAALPDLATTAYDDLLALRADLDYARPGGESHRELAARVEKALSRTIERGGTIVVATHRKPLMCVLSQVLQIDHERIWSVATAPCSLTQIEVWADAGVSVAYVNDTHHLAGIP